MCDTARAAIKCHMSLRVRCDIYIVWYVVHIVVVVRCRLRCFAFSADINLLQAFFRPDFNGSPVMLHTATAVVVVVVVVHYCWPLAALIDSEVGRRSALAFYMHNLQHKWQLQQ